MPVMFHNGQVLFDSGSVALSPDCCCVSYPLLCCPEGVPPPDEMELQISENAFGGIITAAGQESCEACDTLAGSYFLDRTAALGSCEVVSSICPNIEDFCSSLPGIKIAHWVLQIPSWCTLEQHPILHGGCEGAVGETVDLTLQLVLWTDGVFCYYSAQVGFEVPGATPDPICEYHRFDGNAPVALGGGQNCANLTGYMMCYNPDESQHYATPDEDIYDPCWVCGHLYDEENPCDGPLYALSA